MKFSYSYSYSYSVHEMCHDTHTYLYNILHKKPINSPTITAAVGPVTAAAAAAALKNSPPPSRALQLAQSLGTRKFVNATDGGRSLRVMKTGIYYVVLNLFLGNKTSNNSLDFSLTHRTAGMWKFRYTLSAKKIFPRNGQSPLKNILHPDLANFRAYFSIGRTSFLSIQLLLWVPRFTHTTSKKEEGSGAGEICSEASQIGM